MSKNNVTKTFVVQHTNGDPNIPKEYRDTILFTRRQTRQTNPDIYTLIITDYKVPVNISIPEVSFFNLSDGSRWSKPELATEIKWSDWEPYYGEVLYHFHYKIAIPELRTNIFTDTEDSECYEILANEEGLKAGCQELSWNDVDSLIEKLTAYRSKHEIQ